MANSTADDSAAAEADAEVAAFHEDLIALRVAAGAPSYARLARRIDQPRTTVYDAFRRPSLPSRELLTALVTVLGGDAGEWRSRWSQLRAKADSSAANNADADAADEDDEAAQPPATGPRTRSDASGRRSTGRWWAALVTVALVVAAVTVAITRVASGSSSGCAHYRVYRVGSAGSLLDADSVELGRTSAGDIVLVGSTKDHTFRSRYPSIDLMTGKRGYIDESRITFLRDSTCL